MSFTFVRYNLQSRINKVKKFSFVYKSIRKKKNTQFATPQTRKTAAIRRTVVREYPRTSQHYLIEGFKGVPNWAAIMWRDASLSDNQLEFFFQSGIHHLHEKIPDGSFR